VRQHQETFVLDSRQDAIRDIFRTQDTVDIITAKTAVAILYFSILVHADHASRYCLRTDQANMNSVITMRDGQ